MLVGEVEEEEVMVYMEQVGVQVEELNGEEEEMNGKGEKEVEYRTGKEEEG